MLVAVTQSNYIPWRGYFSAISHCDHVVFLDDVQYTRRDWRNRNQIKTPKGKQWLSIPVQTKGKYADMRVCEAMVDDGSWASSHLGIIRNSYKAAPHFKEVMQQLEPVYERAAELRQLSEINRLFIDEICSLLDIDTPLSWSWDHKSLDELDAADSTERLVMLCKAVNANQYISGPAAQAYLEQSQFNQAGIDVFWADYSHFEPYEQLHGEFDGAVSVLDFLMMNGSGVKPHGLRVNKSGS